MLENLLLGLPTMIVCLLLQAFLCLLALRYYGRVDERGTGDDLWLRIRAITLIMTILVIGNVVQLTLWGLLFMAIGEFTVLADAVYHSAVNFATLGYGDIVMSEKHRLLGPIESINGVLMIGISTAALTAAFQDTARRARDSRSRAASD